MFWTIRNIFNVAIWNFLNSFSFYFIIIFNVLYKICISSLLDVSAVGVHLQGLRQGEEEKWCLIHNSRLENKLLNSKSENCNHGKTPILNLGELHSLLTRFILRVHTQRIKSKIPRKVRLIPRLRLINSVELKLTVVFLLTNVIL